jgi:hypothetical protein
MLIEKGGFLADSARRRCVSAGNILLLHLAAHFLVMTVS